MKNIFILIGGGLGKHISFTALLPHLKETYDNIYVSAPYSEIFSGNPYITKINPKTDKDFYHNVLLKDSTKIVISDPYEQQSFIKKEKHILEVWADMCDIKIDNAMNLKPELYMSENEKFVIDKDLNMFKDFTKNKFILVQLSGGQSPKDFEQHGNQEFQYYNEKYKRHYPFDYYVELITKIKDLYPDHLIIKYGLINEPIPYEINKMVVTIKPNLYYKSYHWIAKQARHIICIDSSLQHITVGKKESIVVWGETRPEHFGYSFHKNIIEKNENTISYFKPFGEINENVIFPKPEKILYYLIKN